VDGYGHVTRYEKDSPDALPYVEAGVLALRRRVLDLMQPDGPVSLEKEIFPKLIAARKLIAYITRQRFYDIGTRERLQLIEKVLAHDPH
jgi:NDP-sugar pyrophosphorylase family protein